MKILRISLRNIASLEGTQTVDFTRDPLRAAGLFSISGITGSGKSTLLDALCLALYERTPRLNAVPGAVKLDDCGDSISQKDPANLLRRGTGEGFAEVAFVGVDNAIYTARWSVRRARNRPDGSLQNTEMTLFRGDIPPGTNGAIEQGGKKKEVLEVIAAKVGLSFAQFTRAVLLAQNEFAAFLKADDRERAEILQALTGTERFEEISINVFTRCATELNAIKEVEYRIAGNPPLSSEARVAAESACEKVEADWEESNEKLTACDAQVTWFRCLRELSQQAHDAKNHLEEKRSARDAAAPRRIELTDTEEASRDARPLRDTELRIRAETAAAEKTYEVAANAEGTSQTHLAKTKESFTTIEAEFGAAKTALESVKPQLVQARELDAKLTALTDRLTTAMNYRENAEAIAKEYGASRDALLTQIAASAKERGPLDAKRKALSAVANFAADATAWLDRLDRASECRQQLNSTTVKLTLLGDEETTTTAKTNDERTKQSAARDTAETARIVFEQAEIKARSFDGEKIALRRNETHATRTALVELEKHLKEADSLATQVTFAETEIAKLKAENETDANELAVLKDKLVPEAERTFEGARRSFDLAEAAVTDQAVRFREKLIPGHPCPVCGAKEHPNLAHPPSLEGTALRALRADCTDKDAVVRSLRDRVVRLDTACAGRLNQAAAGTKELASLRAMLTKLAAVQHNHPAAVAILNLPRLDQTKELGLHLETQQQVLSALEVEDTTRRDAEKVRDQLRSTHEGAMAFLKALEQKLAKFNELLAGIRSAKEAATNANDLAKASFQTSLTDLNPLFTGVAECRISWENDAAAFRKKFADEAAQFTALEKRLDELDRKTRESEASLIPASEAFERAASDVNSKRLVETEAELERASVHTLRVAIFQGRPADLVENELTGELSRLEEMRGLRAKELEQATNQLTASTEGLYFARKSLADSKERQTNAANTLDTWLAAFTARRGRPHNRSTLESMLARDDIWIKEERTALEKLEGEVLTAVGAFAVHQKSLDEHLSGRPTTDDEITVTAALTKLRAEHLGIETQRNAAKALLLADDQLIAKNVELTRELAERRTLAEPWIKLNELIGSKDGAKFRAIVQRCTLDILVGYANAQLELLSARYRLERLPESLNLIVLDRDMGDERRSVHSLSGGESFLVSLALALALASLTSNRLRIESLFIDEGFGSLDAETLNTVMSALTHLEAQGRKVGVISHVSEMTDAIPVQIRVIKGRSGASRLVVPGVTILPAPIGGV